MNNRDINKGVTDFVKVLKEITYYDMKPTAADTIT